MVPTLSVQEDPDVQILAIDVAQQKSVAGLYTSTSGQIGYRTVPTTPHALHDLILETSPDRIVIEVGPQTGWICDLVRAMDLVTRADLHGWFRHCGYV